MVSISIIITLIGQVSPQTSKEMMVQAVLNAPKLQLHYYDSYLKGPKRIQIVGEGLASGTPFRLFETKIESVAKVAPDKARQGYYIHFRTIKVNGKRGYVYGEFPAQGVVIECSPVFIHGRWIAAEEKIGIAKQN